MKGKDRLLLIVRVALTFVFLISLVCLVFIMVQKMKDNRNLEKQQELLYTQKQQSSMVYDKHGLPIAGVSVPLEAKLSGDVPHIQEKASAPVMLAEYQNLYQQNSDIIGWLTIDDTLIDYPVMQTPKNEDYYLTRGFDGAENNNGCLILDTDSVAGIGTKETLYAGGTEPSTNLIVHGHTMKSGKMFGNLKLYQDKEYGLAHAFMQFDSLYEKRKYKLIAVFYSQVYYEDQNVFKYYKFFQADTKEEFSDWYDNIKSMSLYDTGVTAEYGDEFITLSCCSYQVEDGRFVVIGKRIE